MAVKCYDHRQGVMVTSIRNRLTNDLLVTEVNAIKEADADADFATAGSQFFGIVDDVHA